MGIDNDSTPYNGGIVEVNNHVKNYMTKDFLTVSPQETLNDVAKKMIKSGKELAIVKSDDKLVGLVSADEIIHEVKTSIVSRISTEKFPEEIRSMLIDELMNNPRTLNFMEACGFEGSKLAISIGEDNTIEEAIQLFANCAIDRCLVLDREGIVGILTNRGLLKAITEMAH